MSVKRVATAKRLAKVVRPTKRTSAPVTGQRTLSFQLVVAHFKEGEHYK